MHKASRLILIIANVDLIFCHIQDARAKLKVYRDILSDESFKTKVVVYLDWDCKTGRRKSSPTAGKIQ